MPTGGVRASRTKPKRASAWAADACLAEWAAARWAARKAASRSNCASALARRDRPMERATAPASASATTAPVIATIRVRDEREEPPPRPSREAGTAEGDAAGEEGIAVASRSTVPVALTSSLTCVHVTVLASFFVEAPGDVTAPPAEASTISEACATRVTESMEASASGEEKPSRSEADTE